MEKNNITENSLYNFIVNQIIRFERIRVGKDKSKCVRITKMLKKDGEFDIGYDGIDDTQPVETLLNELYKKCEKFWSVNGSRTRCRRLVHARVKLNLRFDKNCTIKSTVKSKSNGGKNITMNKRKFNNRRKTKKTGGMEDAAGYGYMVLLCEVVGGILVAVGAIISNPPLKITGIVIMLLPVLSLIIYAMGNS
jgi:hypothetical protein